MAYRELDNTSRHILRGNRAFNWVTPTTCYSLASKWGLLANDPAITTTHIDAGGFATVVEIWFGMKKWYIGNKLMLPRGNQGFDNSTSEWEPLTLRAGDWL